MQVNGRNGALVQVTLLMMRSLAGFNGADHGLTAGSSSGKTQLEFWLGGSRKNIEAQEQILSRDAFLDYVSLQKKKKLAKCIIVQNGRRRTTSEDAQVKSRPRRVTG